MTIETDKRKLELNVGRVKKMSNDGMTVTEIAEKLGLNESTVRSYKAIIDKAEENRKLKEG